MIFNSIERKIGFLFIVLIVFIFFTIEKDTFDKYYHSLKIIELPCYFDCQKNISYPDYSKVSERLDEKYRPMGHKTLGRMELNKNVISIIQIAQAESEVPMIYNYKIDGTPIDTFCLYTKGCSSSPEYRVHSLCQINKDKVISMSDTCWYKLDLTSTPGLEYDSMVVTNRKFIMLGNGQLTKLHEQRERSKL